MFAVQALSPEYGEIRVELVKWGTSRSEPEATEIKLVDCNELLPGGLYEG